MKPIRLLTAVATTLAATSTLAVPAHAVGADTFDEHRGTP